MYILNIIDSLTLTLYHESMKTTYLFSIIGLVFALLFLLNFFHLSIPLHMTTTQASGEFSVVGEGKTEAVPDTAYVDIGVTVSKAASPREAQKQIDTVNNNIVNVMQKLGIPKKDIKTSQYSINPAYDYSNNREKIDGYNGTVMITVKTAKTELVSRVIEEATQVGANQIQGTRFEISDPDSYREQARKKAIENAKSQAEKLAKDLGIKLGRITNIEEYSSNNPQPYPLMFASEKSAMGGGGGPSLQPGSQSITSVVKLYFEKK